MIKVYGAGFLHNTHPENNLQQATLMMKKSRFRSWKDFNLFFHRKEQKFILVHIYLKTGSESWTHREIEQL